MKEAIRTLWQKIRNLYYDRPSLGSLFRFALVRRAAFMLFFIIIIAFLLLTAVALLFPVTLPDRIYSREVQEDSHPVYDFLMKGVSFFGNDYAVIGEILLAAGACFLLDYRREALFCLLTSSGSLVTYLIKLAVNRPRPTDDLVKILQEAEHTSFPSGHVTHYIVFFGFLFVIMFRMTRVNIYLRAFIALFSLVLIITIPVSRVYLGVHWLTDVAGGFLIGLIILAVLLYFYFRDWRKGEGKQEGEPVR